MYCIVLYSECLRATCSLYVWLTGCQGVFVAVLFCFLNGEVKLPVSVICNIYYIFIAFLKIYYILQI